MTYSVYTDGSASPNPGAGGYGIIIYQDKSEPVELSGGFRLTTNNRMELMAAIVALEYLPPGSDILIHSDSKYLTNAFNLGWVFSWQRSKWKQGRLINWDLWVRILAAVKRHKKVKFIWVRGHTGNQYNERADNLANSGRLKPHRIDKNYEQS